MNDIATQLSFGPRAPDTTGHEQTLQYIENQMRKAKAKVSAQQWVDTGADNIISKLIGSVPSQHTMANIVARFYPDNPRRIIVGTHYDSIIRAYRDKTNPDAPMPGANNSASGVALLLETARALNKLPPPPVGIDFVFFDGEEGPKALGAGDPDWHAVGSPYFVDHMADYYPAHKPEQAVLFDMVCYKKMVLKPETLSQTDAPDIVAAFWDIGARRAPSVFSTKPYGYAIDDDHDALNKAGVPSFLVIGFDYEPWFNTTQDTIDKCSQANLRAVGTTLLDYIYSL